MTLHVSQPQERKVLLSVRDLTIIVPMPGGDLPLVENISFEVHEGEVFALVGESGSGKSVTMMAVLGLLPLPLKVISGSVKLRGRELTDLGFAEMRKIRGKQMAIVFQDPMTALNPVLKIGTQVGEAVRLHNPSFSKEDVKARVLELLTLVGIPNPERRYGQYPNEFSGGMRQRVVIAIAMANEPDLLIADEPTTALDVTIQAQVMDVLREVRARTGAAMVLITHDLGLVAEHAERVAVLYAGKLAEVGTAQDIFQNSHHPYTVGLLASLPRVDRRVAKLNSIKGFVPALHQRPKGCAFSTRCDLAQGRSACLELPATLKPLTAGHHSACHYPEEAPVYAEALEAHALQEVAPISSSSQDNIAPIIRVRDIQKQFPVRSGFWGKRETLHALQGISFDIRRGKTLGLVGESGCGKSTLARVLLRLMEASGGDITLNGVPLLSQSKSQLRQTRRNLQVVFQDPYSSLDPRMTVHDIIAEPMRIHGIYDAARVEELLANVGLPPEAAKRKPGQFSGGQRQRIAIARALALKPDVLILDEAVSALDVSIQAQVINLLKELQEELHLTYIFISHDLSVVRHISDDVAVMYLGRIIEYGPVADVFEVPQHPYTQALLSAIPQHHIPEAERKARVILTGDLPNPLNPPSGCAFRNRCAYAINACAQSRPEMQFNAQGHGAACLRLDEPLAIKSA